MPAIGERLREARTRRGASIDDAEDGTKIRARYLRALEDEQYDVLPGRTFVRTFLRSYAEWLGLDARLLVEEYRAQYEGGRTEEVEGRSFSPVAGQGRERQRQRIGLSGGGPGPLAFLGFGALAVILFFLVLGLTAGEEEPGEPSRPASEQAEQAEQAEQQEREARADARERRRSRERRAERRERRSRPRSVSLRVTPSEPTYVCVDNGSGDVRYEGTLTEARRFRGRRLRVNLGKTSVQVSQNGRRVPLNAQSPDPVAYDFRPGTRRRLPLSQAPCA